MSCSLIEIIRRRKDRSTGGLRRPGVESDPQVYARCGPTDVVFASHPGFLPSTGANASSASNDLRAFTLPELKSATRNFSVHNQVGEGGFGLVYKGEIKAGSNSKSKVQSDVESPTKVDVAIKKLNAAGLQGHYEWVTEVHFLGMVDNPYLVKLIGYCAEDDERGIQRLLVYEYMPNKGLDNHIFRGSAQLLSWQTRIKVAIGAAKGLAYLHEDKGVIFRDFKTANILLDEEFNPKLSDFGLARQGPEPDKTHVTTGVKGTYGYAAPEYIQTGHLTFKSDVFSFGVVLLEVLTGRRAMDCNRPRMEQRLLEWVKPFINDPRKFHLAVDPRLGTRYPLKAAMKFASIAVQSLAKLPRARPKMTEIVEGLQKVQEMTHQWENPRRQSTETTIDQCGPKSPRRQATETTIDNYHPKSPRPMGTIPKTQIPGASWEGSNPPAFPLPSIKRPMTSSEQLGAKSPLHPRGARRPAKDPALAMERINQMPVYYPGTTPERSILETARTSARQCRPDRGMHTRYPTPA